MDERMFFRHGLHEAFDRCASNSLRPLGFQRVQNTRSFQGLFHPQNFDPCPFLPILSLPPFNHIKNMSSTASTSAPSSPASSRSTTRSDEFEERSRKFLVTRLWEALSAAPPENSTGRRYEKPETSRRFAAHDDPERAGNIYIFVGTPP